MTEIKHLSWPSIEQFDSVIRQVRTNHDYKGKDEEGSPIYLHDSPYPKIKFIGTEKLHGTNAAIVLHKDGTLAFQSRERILSLQKDNSNFYLTMSNKGVEFLFEGIEFEEKVVIFGEWCGGSIQKGVGLNQLPNLFVIFGLNIDGTWRKDVFPNYPDKGIYDIRNFKKWEIEIDFNEPKLQQNEIVEMVLAVEEASPFAIEMGAVPEKGLIGEGIVFTSECGRYRFKAKGEKHARGSKTNTIAEVDVAQIENIDKFVKHVLKASRLEQGISYLKENNYPIDKKSTSIYLKWVMSDIVKEENETIIKNAIDLKKAASRISDKAKEYYFKELNSNF